MANALAVDGELALDAVALGLEFGAFQLAYGISKYRLRIPYETKVGVAGWLTFAVMPRDHDFTFVLELKSPCCGVPLSHVPTEPGDEGHRTPSPNGPFLTYSFKVVYYKCGKSSRLCRFVEGSAYFDDGGRLKQENVDELDEGVYEWFEFAYSASNEDEVFEGVFLAEFFTDAMLAMLDKLSKVMVEQVRAWELELEEDRRDFVREHQKEAMSFVSRDERMRAIDALVSDSSERVERKRGDLIESYRVRFEAKMAES